MKVCAWLNERLSSATHFYCYSINPLLPIELEMVMVLLNKASYSFLVYNYSLISK
jgi:hypothetical protein